MSLGGDAAAGRSFSLSPASSSSTFLLVLFTPSVRLLLLRSAAIAAAAASLVPPTCKARESAFTPRVLHSERERQLILREN